MRECNPIPQQKTLTTPLSPLTQPSTQARILLFQESCQNKRNKNDNRKKRTRVAERMGRKTQDRKQLSGNRTHRKLYQTSREKKAG